MTLFFGPANALYAYRDYTAGELAAVIKAENKTRIKPYALTGFSGIINKAIAKSSIAINKKIKYTFEGVGGYENFDYNLDMLERHMIDYIRTQYGNKYVKMWKHIKAMLLSPEGVGDFGSGIFNIVTLLPSLMSARYALNHTSWMPWSGRFEAQLDVNEWKNVNRPARYLHLTAEPKINDVIAIVRSVIDLYIPLYDITGDRDFVAYLLLLLAALDDTIYTNLFTRVDLTGELANATFPFQEYLGSKFGGGNFDLSKKRAVQQRLANIYRGIITEGVLATSGPEAINIDNESFSQVLFPNGIDLGSYETGIALVLFLYAAIGGGNASLANTDQLPRAFQGDVTELSIQFLKQAERQLRAVSSDFSRKKKSITGTLDNATVLSGFIIKFLFGDQGPKTSGKSGIFDAIRNYFVTVRLSSKQYFYYLGYMVLDSYLSGSKSNFITQFTSFSDLTPMRYRPFRRFHYISSYNNIIRNEMRLNENRIFNAVEIIDDDLISPDHYKLYFNKAMPPWKVKMFRYKSPDADNEKNKEYYATTLLCRHISRAYDGEILILLNPNIKPYDYLFINDIYRSMVGYVEVDRVVHVFSREGCYTEIKPALATSFSNIVNPGFFASIGLTLFELSSTFREAYHGNSRIPNVSQDLVNDNLIAKSTGIGVSALLVAGLLTSTTAAVIGTMSSGLILGLTILFMLAGRDEKKVQVHVHPVLEHGRPFINDLTKEAFPTYIGRYASVANDTEAGIAVLGRNIKGMLSTLRAAVTGNTDHVVLRRLFVKILMGQ